MAACRFPVQDDGEEEEEAGVEPNEKAGFSGRSWSCRSCTAFILADCIALCCCPCCLLSFLSLAFVKAPYMAGRRLFAVLKKRRRCFSKKRKRVSDMEEIKQIVVEQEKVVNWEEKFKSWGKIKIEDYDQMVGFGDESDKIWAEFLQIGQWGFGRVSFSKEIQ